MKDLDSSFHPIKPRNGRDAGIDDVSPQKISFPRNLKNIILNYKTFFDYGWTYHHAVDDNDLDNAGGTENPVVDVP